MLETPPQTETDRADRDTPAMQGRQLFAYYGLLFLFLALSRSLLIELNSQFDLAIFPKLALGVQQVLDNAAEFDNVLNTLYSLMYAFLFSLPIAIVYRITKDEGQFDPSLGQTIVLLSMVVTAVMIVISGDLARAFGLAGVVAAVRFRNTLDDAKDAVYIFLAIAIGMACGARAYPTAVWTSVVMTTALYLMWRYHFGQFPDRIVSSREGGKKEKKDRKDKKDKKDKKKNKGPKEAVSLSPEAQARIDATREQQQRLAEFAARSREPGEKKSNAAFVIEARHLAQAQSHAVLVLEANGGKWRLATAQTGEGKGGTLEFVGRLAKTGSPALLIQALLEGEGESSIAAASFQSLKAARIAEAEPASARTEVAAS